MYVLTCPYHNARFDVSSGKVLTPPALDDVKQYEVKIDDNKVYVGEGTLEQFKGSSGGDDRTFLIVGGGAAGNAAAEMLRSEGFDGSVLMISADDSLPYDRPNLSKAYLAGEAEPDWIPLRDSNFYDEHDIQTQLETVIAIARPENHVIETADGTQFKYDKLLLATGSTPRVFKESELQSDALHYLRSFHDAKAIVAAAEGAKQAIVLGASFIGLEAAASLTTRGIDVHVAAPEDIPMSLALGEDVGRRFQRLHEQNGVSFHMGTTAKRIGNGTPATVTLSDGTELEADLIVAGLGVEPAVDYLDGTGLVSDGQVVVNEQLQTKHPDIFAAGDIARYPGHLSGQQQRIEHWALAEMQGRHAAKSMLGSIDAFIDTPFFWTRQFGASFKYIGHAREWDDTRTVGDIEEGEFLVGYFVDGSLRAVAASGFQSALVDLAEQMRAGDRIVPEAFSETAQGAK